MIVLAFLTQENKVGKMQSTINQLKHGKGRDLTNTYTAKENSTNTTLAVNSFQHIEG